MSQRSSECFPPLLAPPTTTPEFPPLSTSSIWQASAFKNAVSVNQPVVMSRREVINRPREVSLRETFIMLSPPSCVEGPMQCLSLLLVFVLLRLVVNRRLNSTFGHDSNKNLHCKHKNCSIRIRNHLMNKKNKKKFV